MAGQRRRKWTLHGGRHLRGLALLALVVGLNLTGCAGAERAQAPSFPGNPGGTGGSGTGGGGGIDTGGGGGGGGGGSTPVGQLAGRWENVLVVQTVGDVLTITTTWTFGTDRSCNRSVRTFSLAFGFARTAQESCHFQVVNFALDVTFAGAAGPLRYPYSFVAFSPTRLALGGAEYRKLP